MQEPVSVAEVPAVPAAPPPSPRPPARRPALTAVGVLAALILLGPLALATWLLGTAAGTRAVLQRLPGVSVVAPQGRLLGPAFRAERMRIDLPDGRTLVITQPSWRDARVTWDAAAAWHLHVHAAQAGAQQVAIEGERRTPPSSAPPDGLVAPLGLDVDQLRIDTLQLPELGAQPVRDLRLSLHIGGGPLGVHRLHALSLQWDRLQASGDAQVQAQGPMPVAARLQLQGVPRPGGAASPGAGIDVPQDWTALVAASGPLARLTLTATVRARQQSLDASAQLQPFAAQPLARLQLQARDFDIAPFVHDAPATALTGTAELHPAAAAGPLDITADLRNTRPARWREGGVPIRRLQLAGRTAEDGLTQGQLPSLQLELGTAQQAAGHVAAQLRWQREGGHVRVQGQARLTDVLPAQLDPRAPAMQLSGPAQWDLSWPVAAGPAREAPVLQQLQARLSGRALQLKGSPALEVDINGQASATAFRITHLEARAGRAQAVLSAHGERRGDGAGARWQLEGQLALHAFDPALWWPGSAVARGPHLLDGELALQVDAPAHLEASSRARPLDVLAALRGRADLLLRDSRIAGVPLSGSAQLRTGTTVNASAQLHSGRSELTLDAQLQAQGAGTHDRLDLQWQTDALQQLAPLLGLLHSVTVPELQGDSRGTLQMRGRWPQATLHAESDSTALRVGRAQLHAAQARADWTDTDSGGTLDIQVQDVQPVPRAPAAAASQPPSLQALRLHAQGTPAAHRIELSVDANGLVPAAPAPTPGLGARLPQRLHAQLQAHGALATQPQLRWSGLIDAAELRDPAEAAAATAWLQLAATPLQWWSSAAGAGAALGPSQLRVAGATLHVEQARWQREGAAAPQVDLRLQLEPLAVIPVLNRWQPDFGWSGNLRIGGHVIVHSQAGAGVTADVEFARTDGDLQVEEPNNPDGPQRLGLSEARIAFRARDGTWELQQHVRGGNLGSIEGAQTLHTRAAALWPDADAPLEGHLALQVENLGAWSLWLPAGWRLSGELATQARVGGRFGAPEFTGELTGRRLGVYNVVQGVDWRDAELHVLMRGADARIETFTAHAGSGTLTGTGSLAFGTVPRAQVSLTADHFMALQRVDRRVMASGTADLTLEPRALTLRGRTRIDEALVDISQGEAPSLDDDVDVQRATVPDAGSGERPRREAERHIALDLTVELGDALHVRGRGIDTHLGGEVHLSSPANKLAVNGNVHTVDGTFAAYAQKLKIDRGVVLFTGAPANPRLDIEATRPNLESSDVRVGVTITGTAQNPRVRLFSDPEMSDTDKLSWLVLGRASDGLGRTDLALLQRAAYALLAGNSDAPSLIERMGLDELSVRQNEGTGNVRETVVSLGKQLSRRWYVGYERSLNAVSGTWQLVYRAAQRFTLRAQSGVQNSLDLIWTWNWN